VSLLQGGGGKVPVEKERFNGGTWKKKCIMPPAVGKKGKLKGGTSK